MDGYLCFFVFSDKTGYDLYFYFNAYRTFRDMAVGKTGVVSSAMACRDKSCYAVWKIKGFIFVSL